MLALRYSWNIGFGVVTILIFLLLLSGCHYLLNSLFVRRGSLEWLIDWQGVVCFEVALVIRFLSVNGVILSVGFFLLY